MLSKWLDQIETHGFALIEKVFPERLVSQMIHELTTALDNADEGPTMRNRAGTVVAARNVLELYPQTASIWCRSPLVELLESILGPDYGLVRVLFFDKPPDRTWALAWHKDLTIAVRDNHLPSSVFSKPTQKAGVPHVEAPRELLEQMLTLRIHLDDVSDENGPLKVIPGSQRDGKSAQENGAPPVTIHALLGDVLAMRPLVSHSSSASRPGTAQHRWILHLEFSGEPNLPDGYVWQDFIRPAMSQHADAE